MVIADPAVCDGMRLGKATVAKRNSWIVRSVMEGDEKMSTPQMALVLAAGLGSRLRLQTRTPKPLTRVLGLSLAERVVCTLLDVGIRRFFVTLGHEAENAWNCALWFVPS